MESQALGGKVDVSAQQYDRVLAAVKAAGENVSAFYSQIPLDLWGFM